MSADAKWPWSVLGFDKMPAEPADIRRAYARALKKIDQSRDIEGFTALRQAYEYALALREGRDARKAAKAERKAAAEAPVPEPALAEIPSSEPPVPPAAPDPAAAQQRAAEAQAQADCAALVGLVSRPNLVIGLQERLRQALASPLLDDALFHGCIRRAIVMALRDARRPRADGKGSTIPHEITPALLDEMDQRFGWLSDYAAFRADFGNDSELLALLSERHALIRPTRPAGAPNQERRPAGWSGRFVKALGAFPTQLRIYSSVILLRIIYEAVRGTAAEPIFYWAAGALVLIVSAILIRGLWLGLFGRNASTVLTGLSLPALAGLLAQLWETGPWAEVLVAVPGALLLILVGVLWQPERQNRFELWLDDLRARLIWRRSG